MAIISIVKLNENTGLQPIAFSLTIVNLLIAKVRIIIVLSYLEEGFKYCFAAKFLDTTDIVIMVATVRIKPDLAIENLKILVSQLKASIVAKGYHNLDILVMAIVIHADFKNVVAK